MSSYSEFLGRRSLGGAAVLVLLCGPLLADLFPDKALEAAVRKFSATKRDTDMPLTVEDVKDISTVEGVGKGIKDLTGLENLKSLALLNLAGNEISDLSALAGLKGLQWLDLSKNKIKDLKPLENLGSLQYLQLADNEVSDLAPLAKLERLTSLYLSRNKVADLAPVAGLKKLWSLYVDHNAVSDLKPVAELKRLTTIDVRANQISDLAPLAGLTDLRSFVLLSDNKISDISVLIDMAKKDQEKEKRFAPYWEVHLTGNPLKDEQVEALRKISRVVKFEKK